MEIIKIIGIGLISVIIIVILKQYKPEFAMYASIIAGVLILTMLTDTFKGIINLLQDISNKANVNTQFIRILIKITGIAILTEFAVSICKDTGENAIASKVDIGGKVIIISMSIPIISALLETVLKILPWKRSKKIGKKDNNYINHNNVVFHAKQSTCYAKWYRWKRWDNK